MVYLPQSWADNDPTKPLSAARMSNIETGLATASSIQLIPTAVKTGAYNIQANDYVPVDTTSGSVTLTLPTAPTDTTCVGAKMVIQGGSNTVTINTGGSDVFNKASGSTSATLTLLNQALILQYKASSSIWYVLTDDLPLSQLDTRYLTGPTISSPTFTGTPVAPTPAQDTDTTQIPTTAYINIQSLRRGSIGRSQGEKYGASANVSENVPWFVSNTTNNGMVSGTLYLMLLPVWPNQVITQLSFMNNTAATLGTNNDSHWYLALYAVSGLGLLRQTADQGTGSIAGGTLKQIALTSTYTVPAATYAVYAGFMVYIGTGGSPVMPKPRGPGLLSSVVGTGINSVIASASSTTGLTSGTAPSTAGALSSDGSDCLWMVAS